MIGTLAPLWCRTRGFRGYQKPSLQNKSHQPRVRRRRRRRRRRRKGSTCRRAGGRWVYGRPPLSPGCPPHTAPAPCGAHPASAQCRYRRSRRSRSAAQSHGSSRDGEFHQNQQGTHHLRQALHSTLRLGRMHHVSSGVMIPSPPTSPPCGWPAPGSPPAAPAAGAAGSHAGSPCPGGCRTQSPPPTAGRPRAPHGHRRRHTPTKRGRDCPKALLLFTTPTSTLTLTLWPSLCSFCSTSLKPLRLGCPMPNTA